MKNIIRLCAADWILPGGGAEILMMKSVTKCPPEVPTDDWLNVPPHGAQAGHAHHRQRDVWRGRNFEHRINHFQRGFGWRIDWRLQRLFRGFSAGNTALAAAIGRKPRGRILKVLALRGFISPTQERAVKLGHTGIERCQLVCALAQ